MGFEHSAEKGKRHPVPTLAKEKSKAGPAKQVKQSGNGPARKFARKT